MEEKQPPKLEGACGKGHCDLLTFCSMHSIKSYQAQSIMASERGKEKQSEVSISTWINSENSSVNVISAYLDKRGTSWELLSETDSEENTLTDGSGLREHLWKASSQ